MKKLYTFALVLLCAFVGKAQIINFPDAVFKAKLLASSATASIAYNAAGTKIKIDSNNDGEIQVSEALWVSTLWVNSSSITDLTGIAKFTNIWQLYCQSNQLTVLNVSALINLRSLDCSSNQLTTLNITNCNQLKNLYCSNNQLTNLDVANRPPLIELSCSNNLLTSLNLTNDNALTSVYCDSNQLTTLDVSNKPALIFLNCYSNLLTSLNITNDLALTYLNFSDNLLQTIDLTPFVNLIILNMGKNPYTNVVNINPLVHIQELGLTYLTAANFPLSSSNANLFSSLNKLATDNTPIGNFNYGAIPSLTNLYCNNTNLTSLNLTNLTNLTSLACENNQLTSLDLSPLLHLQQTSIKNNPISNLILGNFPDLFIFNCGNNNFTSIDMSNYPLLNSFYCNNSTVLTTINVKNGTNGSNNFSNCPNLNYICADEGEIASIQTNINTYGYSNCHVNSYCTFTPGGAFYTIQGTSRFDANGNGCDATDFTIPNFKLNFTSGTASANLIPDTSGNYRYDVQAGTHTFAPVFENPNYFNVSFTTGTVTFPTTASPYIQNFCVIPNGSFPDLEVILLPIHAARPGFDAKYKIVYRNKGTNTQSGSVNLTFNDAVLDLVSANPAVTTQVLNALSWNFSNLHPFESREIVFTMNVNAPNETPAVNTGDVLNYVTTISSTATETTPSDNTFAYNQTVVNAFDPNEKVCLEGNTIAPEKVGDFVHYLIRFENDGTANAQNIVVKDMIDTTKFDINTLFPENGSATYTTRVTNTNQVEFVFQNINLPFDAGTNTGYVAFKIKTKPTLLTGNTFSNTASIYFDYNFPINTNTATTTIQALATQDFEFGNYFTLYPNPAKSVLNISTKSSIEVHSLTIYNLLGQVVLAIPNAQNLNAVDVSSFKKGNYFLKITSDKGSATEKFMKE
jgi:uncharacterized repeat protein (TIGR01451 family)